MLVAAHEGRHHRYLARNAGALHIVEDASAWQIEPFEILYVDGAGQRWTLSLPASDWR